MRKVFLSLLIFISITYASSSSWSYESQSDAFTDEKVDIFYNTAYSGEAKFGDKPILVIRKTGNTIEVYIIAKEFLTTQEFQAIVRFDSNSVKTYDVAISTDYKTMFFYPNAVAKDIVYNIVNSNELIVGYTPYSENPRIIKFSIGGLAELAKSHNVPLTKEQEITFFNTANIYTNDLKDKIHTIGWYFWMSDSGKAYLASEKYGENGDISVWNFTDERKWRPIYNASAFDGYTSAGDTFSNVYFSSDKKNITFGASLSTNEFTTDLANKTQSIGWYFWMTNSNKSYLASGRDSSKGIAIWNFTDERKWKPVHNTEAFDGYEKADKVFSSVTISSDGTSITIK